MTIGADAAAGRERLVTPLFVLITLSAFAYFAAYGSLSPVLPRFVRTGLGGGEVAVGIAIGAVSLTAVVLRPLSGLLGDRRGRRVLVVGGATVMAASIAGFHVSSSVPLLVLMRLFGGAGEAAFFVGAATAIQDLAPDGRRGEALSFFTLSLYGGLALGPLIGETVFDAGGFGAVWTVSATLALVAAALGLRLPDTRPAAEHASAGHRIVHPAAVKPGLIMLTSVWAFAGFSSFMPLYAVEDLRMSGSAEVFFVYSMVILGIRFFGARIPDRSGPVRTATVSLGVSALGLGLMVAWAEPAGLFVSSVLFASGQALAFPALMSLAVSSGPASERASIIGTFTAFVDVGFAVGPVSLGGVAAVLGYRGAFAGAALVASAGLVAMVRRRHAARVAEAGA